MTVIVRDTAVEVHKGYTNDVLLAANDNTHKI